MKEPLTLEKVKEEKMNGIDAIHYFKPEWTNDECELFLWECTCFPFSTEQLINQLNDKFINNESI
jgi:hypothetical protein